MWNRSSKWKRLYPPPPQLPWKHGRSRVRFVVQDTSAGLKHDAAPGPGNPRRLLGCWEKPWEKNMGKDGKILEKHMKIWENMGTSILSMNIKWQVWMGKYIEHVLELFQHCILMTGVHQSFYSVYSIQMKLAKLVELYTICRLCADSVSIWWVDMGYSYTSAWWPGVL